MRLEWWLAALGLCLLLLAAGSGQAAAAAPKPNKIRGPLELRYPDAARLQQLQAQQAFRYRLEARPPLSLWDRFWWLVRRALGRLRFSSQSGLVWRYGWYALGVGIMVWVVLRLLGVEISSLFGRTSAAMAIPYETYAETIHGIDFPALIAQAEAQGDYRRAIRLYYLSILQNLSDRALIAWSPSKTNRSYVPEIKNAPLRRAFEDLTRQFEFIWYGGSILQEPMFQQVRRSFEAFHHLVATTP
jgi:hypothetical protein